MAAAWRLRDDGDAARTASRRFESLTRIKGSNRCRLQNS
jgi:hypothetical protein